MIVGMRLFVLSKSEVKCINRMGAQNEERFPDMLQCFKLVVNGLKDVHLHTERKTLKCLTVIHGGLLHLSSKSKLHLHLLMHIPLYL